MADSRRLIRVNRSIAGPVLLEIGDVPFGFRCLLTDQEAIELCDKLRRVIETPTRAEPNKNVVVLGNRR
jgi:hypothetical protein